MMREIFAILLFLLILGIWVWSSFYKKADNHILAFGVFLSFVLSVIFFVILPNGNYWYWKIIVFSVRIFLFSSFSVFLTSLLQVFVPVKGLPHYGFGILLGLLAVMPVCACQALPIILAGMGGSKSRMDKMKWIFLFFVSFLFSLPHLYMSVSLMGIRFALVRSISALIFAGVSALFLERFVNVEYINPVSCSMPFSFRRRFVEWTGALFKASALPILLSAGLGSVFVATSFFADKAGAFMFFRHMRIFGLAFALLGQFCSSQDVILLSGIREFYHNLGFEACFSLFAGGFCLSMLPLYLRLFSRKGVAVLLVVLLMIGGALLLVFS